jgi:hypothetical protein
MNCTHLKWIIMAACGFFASCAIITVNVYFPEKDVKQAYKSLDEMLLKQDGGKPAVDKPPGESPPQAPEKKESPVSSLPLGGMSLSLVPTAWAAEGVADELAIEMAGMDDVIKAYEQMKERLPLLNDLREKGAVGEANDGRVVVRDATALGDRQKLVEDENGNRKAVITGMARALLKINKLPETKENLGQVLGQSARTYADTKRDEARAGWWVQMPGKNGRWVQK